MLRIALVALLLMGSSALSQEQPRHEDKPSDHPEQASASHQGGSDAVPFVVKILPAPGAERKSEQEDQERKNKAIVDEKIAFETQRIADYTDWLARFTKFLFFVALLQAGLFFWQLILIKGSTKDAKTAADAALISANLARAEFNATHRPRIRIKHVWLTSEIWEGQEVAIDLVFVNSGDAPAIVTQTAMATLVISKDDTLPNGYDTWSVRKERYEVSIGKTVALEGLTDHRVLTDPDNVGLRDESKFLYCLGSVDYIDKNDPSKIMKTAFCRILKMPSQIRPGAVGRTSRFMVHNDPDYEYQD